MSERSRIAFVVEQRGLGGAISWAAQTLVIYRKAVLDKSHHGSNKHYRQGFIESYLDLKAFINNGENNK